MQVIQVVDQAQTHAQVTYRTVPPPTTSPPRVQAINRQPAPGAPDAVGTASPDDGISLELSPEAREMARKAALEELRASQTRSRSQNGPKEPVHAERERSNEEAREELAVQEMMERDRDVRSRQQAYAAAVGSLASGSVSYTYRVGPDGRLYAVAGEVKIDTTPIPGDPEATLRKAHQIEKAAFLPGEPSPESRRAASAAEAMAAKAKQELARQQSAEHEPAEPAVHVSQNG